MSHDNRDGETAASTVSQQESETPTVAPPITTSKRMNRKSERTRALLACGLVVALSVGGTLASWNASVTGTSLATGGGVQPPNPETHTMELKQEDGVWASAGPRAISVASPKLPTEITGSRREEWNESAVRVKTDTEDQGTYRTSVEVSALPAGNGGVTDASREYGQSGFFAHPAATTDLACQAIPEKDRIGSFTVTPSAPRARVNIPSAQVHEELRMCLLTFNTYLRQLTSTDSFVSFFGFTAAPLD